MPTAEAIRKKDQTAIDEALEDYLKDNEEIAEAIEVMKQADLVRNRGRYIIESDPYRSIPSE